MEKPSAVASVPHGPGRGVLAEMAQLSELFPRVQIWYREYLAWRATNEPVGELQKRRLRGILAHAAERVPWYRNLSGAVHSDPFVTLCSMRTVDKATIRDKMVDLCDDEIVPSRCWISSTSGTTGIPVRFVVDQEHLVHLYAQAQLRRDQLGVPLHAKFLMPFQNWFDGWLEYTAAHYGLARIAEFGTQNATDVTVTELAARAATFAPDLIISHPSNCLRLAHTVRENRIAWVPPTAISTFGERLLPAARATISEVLGAPVYDTYGMREFGGIAAECPAGSFHIDAERLWVEVLDSDDTPLPDGEVGELTVTNLINRAMPLLRYRTGDMGCLATEPCRCGRPGPTLASLTGRSVTVIELPNGRSVDITLISRIIRRYPVERFQLVRRDPQHLDILVQASAAVDLAAVASTVSGSLRPLRVTARLVDDSGFLRAGNRKHVDMVNLADISLEHNGDMPHLVDAHVRHRDA